MQGLGVFAAMFVFIILAQYVQTLFSYTPVYSLK